MESSQLVDKTQLEQEMQQRMTVAKTMGTEVSIVPSNKECKINLALERRDKACLVSTTSRYIAIALRTIKG